MLDENSLNMSGYSIDELYIGMTKSISKTISENDIYNYAGIIGDFNPLHVNSEYAKSTRFKERVAHGMLTASFFSTLVGMCMPGADAIYLEQNVKFKLPVKIGDTITSTANITKIIKNKKIAQMETITRNQRGEIVIEGSAIVMATK
ncbi:MaoC family dehydratase [Clostridium sp.]|uniref:MaoC family dehydratase n=1 Tax=Clostridium sp. TaxID=1506 RepID=UPI003F2E93A6